MRTLIEEHGGAIATAAVVMVVIAGAVAFGASDYLKEMFTSLLDAFSAKAQISAGF